MDAQFAGAPNLCFAAPAILQVSEKPLHSRSDSGTDHHLHNRRPHGSNTTPEQAGNSPSAGTHARPDDVNKTRLYPHRQADGTQPTDS